MEAKTPQEDESPQGVSRASGEPEQGDSGAVAEDTVERKPSGAAPVARELQGSEATATPVSAFGPVLRPCPPTDTYGTQVEFVSLPVEAARMALQSQKLLFVLHLSGNFEDPQFT
jgi:hypothetical protein